MNSKKILLFCGAFLIGMTTIFAQAKLDYSTTMTSKEMDKLIKKDDGFLYKDFVSGSIYQRAEGDFDQGLVENLKINYCETTNQAYAKVGEMVYALKTSSIKGLYPTGDNMLVKANKENPNELCEIIHDSEVIYVYKMKDQFFGKVWGEDKPLELSVEGIESTFGISSPSIKEYIRINKLDITDKDDLKTILRQYQASL